MTDMPLWIAPDGTVVYIEPNESEPQGIKYIRASELAKAYEAIRDLADDIKEIDPMFTFNDKHAAIIKTAREQGK